MIDVVYKLRVDFTCVQQKAERLVDELIGKLPVGSVGHIGCQTSGPSYVEGEYASLSAAVKAERFIVKLVKLRGGSVVPPNPAGQPTSETRSAEPALLDSESSTGEKP